MGAPGDMTPARMAGALRMSAVCRRTVFAGLVVLPPVAPERRLPCLRGIAMYVMMSHNLDPTGNFEACHRVRGVGSGSSESPLVKMASTFFPVPVPVCLGST
jgi:hypothetical protein